MKFKSKRNQILKQVHKELDIMSSSAITRNSRMSNISNSIDRMVHALEGMRGTIWDQRRSMFHGDSSFVAPCRGSRPIVLEDKGVEYVFCPKDITSMIKSDDGYSVHLSNGNGMKISGGTTSEIAKLYMDFVNGEFRA